MSKKMKPWFFAVAIILGVAIALSVYRDDPKEEYWTHRSFQGTVLDVWTEQDSTIVSVELSGAENVKRFIITADTIFMSDFEIGTRVLIESDYDMYKHNGEDVPYPVVMLIDAAAEGGKQDLA